MLPWIGVPKNTHDINPLSHRGQFFGTCRRKDDLNAYFFVTCIFRKRNQADPRCDLAQ